MKIKLRQIGLLTAFIILTSTMVSAQKTAEEFYILGKQQRQKSQIDEAIKSQTECIRLNPKHYGCYQERGELYGDALPFTTRENAEIQDKQALADYSEAIRLKPDFYDVYQKRAAKYYYGKLDYEKAFPDYMQLLKLKPADPQNSIIHYLLGTIYATSATVNGIKGPNFDKAIEEFSAAIKLNQDPTYFKLPDYYRDRGMMYSAKGEHHKAIGDLTEAIRLSPDSYHYKINRAIAYEKKGDYEKALQDIATYRTVMPDDIVTIQLRAGLYCKTGKPVLAAADEKKAAEIGVPVKDPCHASASSIPSTGGEKTAEQLFAEGTQLAKQKDFDGAIAVFSQCIALKADAFPCFLYRGTSYALKNKPDEALADYNQTLKINPNLPGAYVARGMLYLKLQKKDLAANDFRAALKIEPDHRQAQQGLQQLGVQP